MRTIKIASEITDRLVEVNNQIRQMEYQYQYAKQQIEQQFVPKLNTLRNEQTMLLQQADAYDDAMVQQQSQKPSPQTPVINQTVPVSNQTASVSNQTV